MLSQVSPPIGGPDRVQRRKPFVSSMPMDPTAKRPAANPPGNIGGPQPVMSGMMGTSPQPATDGMHASSPMPTMPVSGSMASGPRPVVDGAMTPGLAPSAPSAPLNGGNPRYGSDNAPVGGVRPPAGGVNPAWGPQSGVSPFNATSGATGIGDFQRFSDAAYERQAGRLTPQFEAQERGFEQDMVNRGIAPGTPAYDNARANFENSRNDAFEGARTQADQLGAALQQQSFQQGATNSGLLNQLLLGQMGADASRFGATTSANASMHNAGLGAQSAANQLAQNGQQFDSNYLLQLLGIGQGNAGFNNGVIGQNNGANSGWLGQNQGLLGLFGGGGTPGNIDVTSGYNNQYNAGLNQSQWQQQQNNSNNQNYAQWASILASMYGGGG